MIQRISYTFLLCLLTVFSCMSQTHLPSFFGDNMILQQKDSVKIWGEDLPHKTIVIQTAWGSMASGITNNEGKWELKIKTPSASSVPQTITITGSSSIKLKNVLIGEVWFCSGQSNMEMPMKGFANSPVLRYNEFILDAANSKIRLFKAERQIGLHPVNDIVGSWTEATPASVKDFSAVAYLFAKKLQRVLKIPIGVICSSWGGTKIKGWTSKEALKKYDFIEFPTSLPTIEKEKRETPTLLYNGMINPFIGYGIKGILWYQGETDRLEYEKYKILMPNLVESWRNKWDKQSMPFYFVQIAPYDYSLRNKTKKPIGALLREAQLHSFLKMHNTGMVVTADVGDCNDIHPLEKEIVATRLAYLTLAKDYGFTQIIAQSPFYKSMKINENKIELTFDDYTTAEGNGLTSYKKELTGFVIAGKDKVFYPAKAIITTDKKVEVYSEKVKNPEAVRYGFENCFQATLFNTANLPASPFRTDNWDFE
ncbi:sialate O-acetylesterase [Abyssalbus ytuae]|uniref:Sialate O-acetylesterase n=1 Tax=Abyssalbus ytuae TaxID=2926907 RepID=A0A9E6ZNW1_9FLAO|nr:sialate O-acetylesterase [Abyssalbus ytuae]UOB17805.1 sialate O-acetylesterase [Abyssalbus ytuae]